MRTDLSPCSQRANVVTWAVFTLLVTLTTAADLTTKAIAFKNLGMPGTSPGWPVIKNVLWYRTSLNEGALFGLGQGMGWFFITVSVAALIGILFTVSWLRMRNDTVLIVALACITGGILGNLYDRLGFNIRRPNQTDCPLGPSPREPSKCPLLSIRQTIQSVPRS